MIENNSDQLEVNISASGLLLELFLRSWHLHIPVDCFKSLLEKASKFPIHSVKLPYYMELPLQTIPDELFLCEQLSTEDIKNVSSIWARDNWRHLKYWKIGHCLEIFAKQRLPLYGFVASLAEINEKIHKEFFSKDVMMSYCAESNFNQFQEVLNYIHENIISTSTLRYYASLIFWVIYQHQLVESNKIDGLLVAFLLDIILHNNNFEFLVNSERLRHWLMHKLPGLTPRSAVESSSTNDDLFKPDKKNTSAATASKDETFYLNYHDAFRIHPYESLFPLKLYSIFMHRLNPEMLLNITCSSHIIADVQTPIGGDVIVEKSDDGSMQGSKPHQHDQKGSKENSPISSVSSESAQVSMKFVNVLPLELSESSEFVINTDTLETYMIRSIHTWNHQKELLSDYLPLDSNKKEFSLDSPAFIHPYSLRHFRPFKFSSDVFKSPNKCLASLSRLFCICQPSQLLQCSHNIWNDFYESRQKNRYLPAKKNVSYSCGSSNDQTTQNKDCNVVNTFRMEVEYKNYTNHYTTTFASNAASDATVKNLQLEASLMTFKNKRIAYDKFGVPFSIIKCSKPNFNYKKVQELFLLCDAFTKKQYCAYSNHYARSTDESNAWIKWDYLIPKKSSDLCTHENASNAGLFQDFKNKINQLNIIFNEKKTDLRKIKNINLSSYLELIKLFPNGANPECYKNVVSESTRILDSRNKVTEKQIISSSILFPFVNTSCILLGDCSTQQLVLAQLITNPRGSIDYFYSKKEIDRAIKLFKSNQAVYNSNIDTRVRTLQPNEYTDMYLPQISLELISEELSYASTIKLDQQLTPDQPVFAN